MSLKKTLPYASPLFFLFFSLFFSLLCLYSMSISLSLFSVPPLSCLSLSFLFSRTFYHSFLCLLFSMPIFISTFIFSPTSSLTIPLSPPSIFLSYLLSFSLLLSLLFLFLLFPICFLSSHCPSIFSLLFSISPFR